MGYFDTGLYNVQSTLFAWMYSQLLVFKPSLISTVQFVIEWPEEKIVTPLWSMIILGVDSGPGFQGSHVGSGQHGDMRFGIAQVDCWVSRDPYTNPSWVAQLAQMQDTVTKAVHTLQATGSGLIIKDFYTDAQAPSNTNYRLTITGVERRQPPVDPNPSIERKRILLTFQWVERI